MIPCAHALPDAGCRLMPLCTSALPGAGVSIEEQDCYEPACLWEVYQANQTYEACCAWLKHRAYCHEE